MARTGQQEIDGHNDHARHNESLAEWMTERWVPENSLCGDWIFVVLQYAAFHYVTAKLLSINVRPHRLHLDRNNEDGTVRRGIISLVGEHLGPEIEASYRMLHDMGQQARYRAFYVKWASVDLLQELTLQRFHLNSVKVACGQH